ncbi:MAG: hypothetical protein A2Y25_00460 [Candidatus Melainabacteria bacterium GWF2_37_15]|nr:MAG: hypothetical protein A2Y25_00460 [Candidatus Melainabacteria bacterium GWF2_37_15]
MLTSGYRLSEKILTAPVQGIDENGIEKTYTLSDFLGEYVVLYFCPMDSSPECEQEAREFNEKINNLSKKATVICVSPDSIEGHKNFQEQLGLDFVLFSDTDYRITKAFGAWGEKKMFGMTFLGVIRSTFLIGKEGVIKHAWPNVTLEGHVEEVVKVLDLLD